MPTAIQLTVLKTGDTVVKRVLLRGSGDLKKDQRLIDALEKMGNGSVGSNYVHLETAVSGTILLVTSLLDLLQLPGLIAAAVFCVFAALLQMNFLSVSLERKKKEFGILRALGAKKKDIAGICIVESFLITAIGFILSAVAVAITCFVLNRIYRIVMFIFGWLPIVALIVLCFGVAALSAILPAVRIGKQKPIDVIRSIE